MIQGIEGMVLKEVCYYKSSVKFVMTDPQKILADKDLEIRLVKLNGIPQVIFTIDSIIVWRSGIWP